MKSLSVKFGIIFLGILCWILIAQNVFAQEIGRYQVVPLPKGQDEPIHALIIDTKEGHIWTWDQYNREKGTSKVGRYLIYQGKVKPGSRMGEVIQSGGLP